MADQKQALQPEIRSVLQQLKQRIRRYVMLEGTALVVIVLLGLFWISLLVDVAYFSFSRLDLPVWFRAMFRVVTAAVAVLGFASWVVLRLVRSFRARALALVLERRFPELDDRLISAVELSETQSASFSELTRSMIQQTIDGVSRALAKLDLGAVFDRVPLRRAFVTASVLVASVIAFSTANQAAMKRWVRAYVTLQSEYWERETALVCRVVAQPGDVVKDFEELEDRFEYRHPRGTDLSLLIEVPTDKRPDGQAWKEPDRVLIDLDAQSGSGSRVPLTTAPYRYSVSQVQEDLEITIRGGDFINRKPYVIKVVDQPRIDEIKLQVKYPDYTGLNELVGPELAVQGLEISLPNESRFVFTARTNKRLTRVRVQSQPEQFEIELTPAGAQLTLLGADGERQVIENPGPLWEDVLDVDGSGFRIPFGLTARAIDPQQRIESELGYLWVDPETDLRVYLSDEDDVTSLEPIRLSLRGVADQPPEFFEFRLDGIGRAITRKAVIPIAGRLRDDYGIDQARFEFRVDGAEQWNVRPFLSPPRLQPRDFVLQRSENESTERFEVLPLDLQIGQNLALTVFAADADNLNGPNIGRSQEFIFKIVTTEELLSILYEREINLRRRFEQIIREVTDKREELLEHRSKYDQLLTLEPDGADPETLELIAKLQRNVVACAERSLHDIPKNQNETGEIANSFQDILDELINNGVHTSQMVSRLEGLIVQPLQRIANEDFPDVVQAVYGYKAANDNGRDPRPEIDASVERIETTLAHMRAVLTEIEDLAEFHEALRDLKEIIESQQELSTDTKEEQKRKFIENLKRLENLNP